MAYIIGSVLYSAKLLYFAYDWYGAIPEKMAGVPLGCRTAGETSRCTRSCSSLASVRAGNGKAFRTLQDAAPTLRSPQALREVSIVCRKGGTHSVLGVYGLMDKVPVVLTKGGSHGVKKLLFAAGLAMLPTSVPFACTLCHSELAHTVRAAVFGEDFYRNVAVSLLPFLILAGVAALVYRGGRGQ